MTVIKTLHNDETGEPTRIKYNGENVYVSFAVHALAEHSSLYVAVLDCAGTYETATEDRTAYLDLEEMAVAYEAVGRVPFVENVETPFANMEETDA